MILAACPACQRLYDVQHLDPGSRVRCTCDEVFAVPARSPLPAQALSCSNCGGTLAPGDVACTFCGAALDPADRRDSLLCPKCFTRMAEDARHCPGCGIAIDPQALAPVPDGRACPRCGAGLRTRSLDVTDVVECGSCAGMWLSPRAFERLRVEAEQGRRGAGDERARAPGEGTSEAAPAARYVPCLVCGELMFRRQYRWGGRSSGVVVDLCREHGIWLDHGELRRILAHVSGRGPAPSPSPDGWSGIDAAPELPSASAWLPGAEREPATGGAVRRALLLLRGLLS